MRLGSPVTVAPTSARFNRSEWSSAFRNVDEELTDVPLKPVRGEVPDGWRTYSFSELDFAQPETPTHWENALGTGPSDSSLSILREDRFTLVEFAADLPPILYDHEGRGEQENVADQPEHQQDLHRLTRLTLRHRMKNMDHTLSLDTITKGGARQKRRHKRT